ncbi:hypothetical protein CPC08DRAFT_770719 [Agrocybe pediades]|nr:hypothetical protein CPC08DRAFT_770719 [Agrocybe pediades]
MILAVRGGPIWAKFNQPARGWLSSQPPPPSFLIPSPLPHPPPPPHPSRHRRQQWRQHRQRHRRRRTAVRTSGRTNDDDDDDSRLSPSPSPSVHRYPHRRASTPLRGRITANTATASTPPTTSRPNTRLQHDHRLRLQHIRWAPTTTQNAKARAGGSERRVQTARGQGASAGGG